MNQSKQYIQFINKENNVMIDTNTKNLKAKLKKN